MCVYPYRVTSEAAQIATAVSALGGDKVLSVTQLPGSSSLPSWRVSTPKGVYAARLYPPDRAANADRQSRLLSYLADQRYPVPKVALVGTQNARPLLALRWTRGLTVAGVLREQPSRAEPLGTAFGRAHARLHVVPVTSELRTALQRLPPRPNGGTQVLVHFDYHLLNVMTDGEGITGVIDWENVRLGDARYDVARSLSIFCVDPGFRLLPGWQRQVVRRSRQGYLRGYRQVAGPGALSGLAPFLAWSGRFMRRDLEPRLDARAAAHIERWASRWRYRSSG